MLIHIIGSFSLFFYIFRNGYVTDILYRKIFLANVSVDTILYNYNNG